jgi:isopenicillin N synthase-like dioxygenase
MSATLDPSSAAPAVKTIDFSLFLSEDSDTKRSTANGILESFKTIGFVCLTNHGLPQSRVDEMFGWVSTLRLN